MDGATANELSRHLRGVPPSALHRSLQRMCAGAHEDVKNVGPGLQFVERFPDPAETRRFRYRASPLGVAVLTEAGFKLPQQC